MNAAGMADDFCGKSELKKLLVCWQVKLQPAILSLAMCSFELIFVQVDQLLWDSEHRRMTQPLQVWETMITKIAELLDGYGAMFGSRTEWHLLGECNGLSDAYTLVMEFWRKRWA